MSGSPRREAGGSKDVFAGARVSISGLVRRTDLNGCVAEVGRWLEAEGRWSVTCAGAVIAVKETHLTASHAAPCGAIGGWYEVYLNHAAAEAATCAAGALADSNSIVVQGNVASPAECAVLKAFAASNYDKLTAMCHLHPGLDPEEPRARGARAWPSHAWVTPVSSMPKDRACAKLCSYALSSFSMRSYRRFSNVSLARAHRRAWPMRSSRFRKGSLPSTFTIEADHSIRTRISKR